MLEQARAYGIRLLRWSEKYTKTDMVYLIRGGSLSLFGQGMSLVASLALAVAVSHFVSKESYGIYKYAISVVTILSLFSLNSLGSAVFQSAAQGFDGALKRAFWENIRWSAIIFVGTFGLAGYYFLEQNPTLAIGILIGGSLSPFLASAGLFSSFLGGKKDFYRQTIYGIIDNVVPILLFIGVILFTQNPLILIITYFLTNTLAGFYFYRRTIEVYQASMHLHDENMLSYSKHLSVMGIVSGIANNLDQILLFHFAGAAELAIYNFATAIPDMMKGPVKNLDGMMQARFTMHSGANIKRNMGNKLLWYFAFMAFATVVYILLAPYIFLILFPTYMDAVWYSQIYALWIIAIAFDPFNSYFAAKKLVKEQYVVNVISSVFQIGSMVVGVIVWGILGVIVARIATRVVVDIINYFLYRTAIDREIASTSNA